MREGLVGLRHLVRVLTALDAGAKAVAGVEQLVHQPLGHRLLPALAGVYCLIIFVILTSFNPFFTFTI
jgi:hypothetical protein